MLTFKAQAGQRKGDISAADEAVKAALEKNQWDLDGITFKRRRTQAARDTADDKVRLSTDPGGALNYAEQANSARTRALRDFIDVIGRISPIRTGLNQIYNVDVPVPNILAGILDGSATSVDAAEAIEQFAIWVRECIAKLVRFTQNDQTYTLLVSVKQTNGLLAWNVGVEEGTWKVQLEESIFPKQCHVRVRGVNLYAGGAAGAWRAELTPPTTAKIIYLSKATAVIDQSSLSRFFRKGHR